MYPDDKTFSHYMNFLDSEIVNVTMENYNVIVELRDLLIRPGHKLFPNGKVISLGKVTFCNVPNFNREESEYIGNPTEGKFKPTEQFKEEYVVEIVKPLYSYEIEGIRIYPDKKAWINWEIIASGYQIELQEE